MAQKKSKKTSGKVVASNKKARYNYEIINTLEVGIVLKGTEVKALREGKVSINEAFASDLGGELFLQNAYIAEYSKALFPHEPKKHRKLLLHRRELTKILAAVQRKGRSIVPLSIYFNKRGLAKVQLAEVIGKRIHDKRDNIKERDWNRQKTRLLRNKY